MGKSYDEGSSIVQQFADDGLSLLHGREVALRLHVVGALGHATHCGEAWDNTLLSIDKDSYCYNSHQSIPFGRVESINSNQKRLGMFLL